MAKKQKTAILSHERELLQRGTLEDTSHKGASARWLTLPAQFHTVTGMARLLNLTSDLDAKITVFRHMSDVEFAFLRENNQLPDTQPYQTIVCGEEGFNYCMKYFTGIKKVDSNPTTIVQFLVDKLLIDELFQMQAKAEDGVMSHGLGDKGGKGLPKFNEALEKGQIQWVIRLVKRNGKN